MELDDPLILIHEVSNLHAVAKVLELALKKQRPLLIVAEDLESEALGTLIINKLCAGIKVCAVKAPGFGEIVSTRTKELDDRLILIHDKKVSLHAVAKVVELALKVHFY
ncbi:hypothetical protein OsI_37870 [Oryza sativa Indica Group]|uniref:Uncharacterized protein n=1 Tax=Oryza sativa subsp. indica TaxID=39946 RepID=A2ZJ66_ORYSI|nr:hypothetical protein OsI_37870 [Oryza sativa Indica Group]